MQMSIEPFNVAIPKYLIILVIQHFDTNFEYRKPIWSSAEHLKDYCNQSR